jgi:hypothetical protein
VNIELQYATEICFENVILDHWNSTSPGPPFLIFQMLSVLAENQTHIFIEHATNSSGNKITLVNVFFSEIHRYQEDCRLSKVNGMQRP